MCVVVSARRPPLASVFIFPPATEQVSHHPEYFLVRCNAALAPYIPPCWLPGAVEPWLSCSILGRDGENEPRMSLKAQNPREGVAKMSIEAC